MGYTLKQARIGANMTQQEVAEGMHMHVQTYAKYERHPELMSIKEATEFAKIVKVDMASLIFLPIDSN